MVGGPLLHHVEKHVADLGGGVGGIIEGEGLSWRS
jgi:hypothetical protein